MQDEIRDIPTDLLHEPFVLMRPVLRDSIEYLERRDSIERHSFLNSILVRPSPRYPGKFEIIDGMWRFTAAVDLRRETIPCIIKHGCSDNELIALQIQANEVNKHVTPMEAARHLRRIFERLPNLTSGELARIAGKHTSYVKDRLGLLELPADMQIMVDRGEIPAQSAYMLAKIPARWRRDQVDNARTMTGKEFRALAAGLIKQFTEYVQQGRMDERYQPEFKPQPHQRGIKEVKAELDSPTVGATILVTEGCRTLNEAWNAALRWTLHLDRDAIEKQRQAAQALQHRNLLTKQENDDESPPE